MVIKSTVQIEEEIQFTYSTVQTCKTWYNQTFYFCNQLIKISNSRQNFAARFWLHEFELDIRFARRAVGTLLGSKNLVWLSFAGIQNSDLLLQKYNFGYTVLYTVCIASFMKSETELWHCSISNARRLLKTKLSFKICPIGVLHL